MKKKATIIILSIAILFIITGALFKLMHWGFGENAFINGNTILAAGLGLKVIALIVFMISMIKSSNDKETHQINN